MSRSIDVVIVETRADRVERILNELRQAGFDPRERRVETEAELVACLDGPVDVIIAAYSASPAERFGALQALDCLRARAAGVPLIVVSDVRGEEVAVECMKRGAADYLCADRSTRLGSATSEALSRRPLAPPDGQPMPPEAAGPMEAGQEDPAVMLRALLDTTPDVVIFKDLNHIFLACSRAKCAQRGLPNERLEGKTDFDLFPPDEAERFRLEETQVIATGEPMVAEHLLDTAQGWRWYEAIKCPVRDDSGRIVGLLCTERDITDRKEAEAALRESERRLKRLQEALVALTASDALNNGTFEDACREIAETSARSLEVSRVSIWWLSEDHTALRCLDEYDFLSGQHARDFELDLAQCPTYVRALLENRIIVAHDVRTDAATREMHDSHLNPPGTASLLDVPIRIAGRVVGVICHAQLDVPRQWTSEEQAFAGSLADMLSLVMERRNRRHIEAERDEQRRMLRVVLDTLPDFILFKDRNSAFRVCNKAFADFVGMPADQIVGKTDLDLFRAEDAMRFADEERHVMDTGETVVNEHQLIGSHGLRWDEAIKTPLEDEHGRIIGVLTAGRDVTARKLAEAERDAQRGMLRAVLDTTPDLVIFKDRDSVYRMVNAGYGRFYDRSPESLIGLTDFDLWPAEQAATYRAEDLQVMATGEPFTIERLRDVAHSQRWHEVIKVRVCDQQGEVLGVLLNLRDITDRKKAEDAVARRAREMTALYETSLANAVQRDTPALLQSVVKQAADLVGTGVGELHLIRPDGTFEVAASHNLPSLCAALPVRLGEGLTGRVAETGEPTFVEDYCRWEGRAYLQARFHRALSVPLKIMGKVIGVITVYDVEKTGPFDEDEIRLASLFADQAAIALENARLYEEAQRELTERTRAETDLRRERDFSAGILETTEALVNVLDHQGRIVLFNRKCEEISGYSEQEVLGRVIWEFLVPPEDIERVKEALGGWPVYEPPCYYENPWLTKDGRRVPLVWRNAALHDPATGQVLIIASGLDISERVVREREIERRNRELTLLYETLRAASTSLDPREVYPGVVRALADLGGFPVATVRLVQDGQLVICAEVGPAKFQESFPVDFGLHGRVMRTGEPQFVTDVAHDPDYVSFGADIVAEICVPIKVDGEIVALLNVESTAARVLTEDDYRLMLALAGQLRLVMNNAVLYRRLQTEHDRVQSFNQQLLALQSMATAVSSHLDLRGLLDYVTRAAVELLEADSAGILFPNDEGVLTIHGSYGLEADTIRDTRPVMGQGVTGLVAQTGRPIIIDDIRADARGDDGGSRSEAAKSLISTPLFVGKSVIGTLDVHSLRRTHAFTEDHSRVLSLLANQAAAAIANARLYSITTESEARYRALFEKSLDGIVLVDTQTGQIIDANPALELLLGYSLVQLRQRKMWEVQPSEDGEAMRRRWLGRQHDDVFFKGTTRFLTRSGIVVEAEFSGWRIDAGGNAVRVVAIRDITDRLQLEEQLRQAQKMEAIGTLAGGIAHDFNNLLGAILGYASFIKEGLPPDSPLRGDAETVERSALRGADLTRQLLAFARGGRYEMQPLRINSSVKEVIQLLSRTVDKSIAIQYELDAGAPPVQADAGQIQQLLLNLCLNACEAMPEGGVLTVETETVSLDADHALRELGKHEGTFVLLSVSDTGHGIDSETLSRIFEPFFSTKKDQPGRKHSGLGLAVVFGIVKAHDGVIRVESQPGQGARFRIWLPAVAGTGAAEQQEPKPIVRQQGVETVLVVDDEEWMRSVLERVLTGAGYRVLLAASGVEGLEIFQADPAQIDLVILDMIMPGLSGSKTFQLMKQSDPNVCVLIASGYSEQGEAGELLDAGAHGFIQKPFMVQDILTRIRSVLDRRARSHADPDARRSSVARSPEDEGSRPGPGETLLPPDSG